MGLVATKPVFGVSNKGRLKPVSSASDWNFAHNRFRIRVILSKKRIPKALISYQCSLRQVCIFAVLDKAIRTKISCAVSYEPRVPTGLKSTRIYRTVLKSPWKLNLPWKVLEKHSKALKSPWILPLTGGFNSVFGDLNQYNAAPNKSTTILY